MNLTSIKQHLVNSLEEMIQTPDEIRCLFHHIPTDNLHFATRDNYHKVLTAEGANHCHGLGCCNYHVLANLLHHVPWSLFVEELNHKLRHWSPDIALNSLSNWRCYARHLAYMPEVQS